MDRPVIRKPRLFFDTAQHPSHVTFDDGYNIRRTLPWMHFNEARWEYGEPEFFKIEIGECLVVLRGYNLGALCRAVEEHTLLRVRAEPEQSIHEDDCIVTHICFAKPNRAEPSRKKTDAPQMNLELG